MNTLYIEMSLEELMAEKRASYKLFSNIRFEMTILRHMSIRNCRFVNCIFVNSTFSFSTINAMFENCDMAGLKVFSSDFSGSCFDHSNIAWARFEDTYLAKSDLQTAKILRTRFNQCDLSDCFLPSPTEMLTADWGEVSRELTRDLMNYDASCHPNPAAFEGWAKGGDCPYNDVKILRAANFQEVKDYFDPSASLVRPYDLMERAMKEKCPPWSEETKLMKLANTTS